MNAEQAGAFFVLVSVCSGLGSILSLLLLLAKPMRERLFGLSAIRDGQKCMLRADMLAAYYKHRDEKPSGSMNMRISSMNIRLTRRCAAIRSSSALPVRSPNGRS